MTNIFNSNMRMLNSGAFKKLLDSNFIRLVLLLLFLLPFFYLIKPNYYKIKKPVYCLGFLGYITGKGFSSVNYKFAGKEYKRSGRFPSSQQNHYSKWILMAVDSTNPERANILYKYLMKSNNLTKYDTFFRDVPYDLIIDSTGS